MLDYLMQFISTFSFKLRKILFEQIVKNKNTSLVRTILSKYYMIIILPALIITGVVFYELNRLGIIDDVTNSLKIHLDMISNVARECTKHILEIEELIQCLE